MYGDEADSNFEVSHPMLVLTLRFNKGYAGKTKSNHIIALANDTLSHMNNDNNDDNDDNYLKIIRRTTTWKRSRISNKKYM